MPLRDRLLCELGILARDFGWPTAIGILVHLPLTHADLAEMVAAARANVTRALAALREAGDIDVTERRIALTRHLARGEERIFRPARAVRHPTADTTCVARHAGPISSPCNADTLATDGGPDGPGSAPAKTIESAAQPRRQS